MTLAPTRLIILGSRCRVSWDMSKLGYRRESSFLEWTWTDSFTDVLYILNKVFRQEDITLERKHDNDVMVGTSIKTSHYLRTEYAPILKRRVSRFLDDLCSGDNILFLRDNVEITTRDETDALVALLHQFHPQLSYKLLLLNKNAETITDREDPRIYRRVYDMSSYQQYIDECIAADGWRPLPRKACDQNDQD